MTDEEFHIEMVTRYPKSMELIDKKNFTLNIKKAFIKSLEKSFFSEYCSHDLLTNEQFDALYKKMEVYHDLINKAEASKISKEEINELYDQYWEYNKKIFISMFLDE